MICPHRHRRLLLHNFLNRLSLAHACMSLLSTRILGRIPVLRKWRHDLLSILIPHEKCQIHTRAPVLRQPPALRFRQCAVQYANDAVHLIHVTLSRGRKGFGMNQVELFRNCDEHGRFLKDKRWSLQPASRGAYEKMERHGKLTSLLDRSRDLGPRLERRIIAEEGTSLGWWRRRGCMRYRTYRLGRRLWHRIPREQYWF